MVRMARPEWAEEVSPVFAVPRRDRRCGRRRERPRGFPVAALMLSRALGWRASWGGE